MSTRRPGIPRHVAEAIGALHHLGWVTADEAAARGVRDVRELAELWPGRDTPAITISGWQEAGVPRQVVLFHLGALEDTPRRPPLRSV